LLIYCSPLLLHHLGLAAHGATVAVMTPTNESTMLPPPAAKAVVALVRTPPPDPLLGRADGPNAATLAKALRRHFRRRRVLQVGDTFAVAVRAARRLGEMVRRGVLAPPSPAASELICVQGAAEREAAGGQTKAREPACGDNLHVRIDKTPIYRRIGQNERRWHGYNDRRYQEAYVHRAM
jgi:hypothetical protein